eukprot:5851223-Prymnesium_polylepis.2
MCTSRGEGAVGRRLPGAGARGSRRGSAEVRHRRDVVQCAEPNVHELVATCCTHDVAGPSQSSQALREVSCRGGAPLGRGQASGALERRQVKTQHDGKSDQRGDARSPPLAAKQAEGDRVLRARNWYSVTPGRHCSNASS